jgi:hypothetical protein
VANGLCEPQVKKNRKKTKTKNKKRNRKQKKQSIKQTNQSNDWRHTDLAVGPGIDIRLASGVDTEGELRPSADGDSARSGDADMARRIASSPLDTHWRCCPVVAAAPCSPTRPMGDILRGEAVSL